MVDFVLMFMDDNVIIACRTFQKEDIVENFSLIEPIISGHKISTKAISQGDSILKYGQTIGYAMSDIPCGAHLHTHNVEFCATDAEYQFGTNLRDVAPVPEQDRDSYHGISA
jgi:altronate hydrolase